MMRVATRLRRLARDASGLALTEFAFSLPVLMLMGLTGAEITNYIITRMRVSQIALHLADNAARIGSGSTLQAKEISEVDINDLLTGAGYQSGELKLYERGRVIISSLEQDPANSGRYRIRWQRCRGNRPYNSPHDNTKTNLAGMGPAGRQVIAPVDGATMFVEVYYEYKPLVKNALAPSTTMVEIASMMVRDRRALNAGTNGVVQVSGETPASSTC
ncbi:TadE/TadG family type IV pilus assembly protein [Sphingomonas baiyangensis]|uniref:Pilus assembly protein n=1 Tax=Sphingomonas baiyangensis TaxID=2572576 RepID=A0A4V5PTN6_9SPHN|nr:pilus assembly protein [Sphingomonas baiyangensis]TKD50698.1 pilus assembly protein [Sphingomonas baiyangensis]